MAKNTMDYAIYKERPYGILISGDYKQAPDYSIHRPSGRVDWLLIYTIAGEGEIRAEGKSFPCRSGNIAILKPGIPHHYATKGANWEFLWVHFIPNPQWSTWLRLPEAADRFYYEQLKPDAQNPVREALAKMVKHDGSSGHSELNRRLAELALEEALIRLRLEQADEPDERMDPRIRDVLNRLQQFPAEKISLPELAKFSCMSTSRLSHLFKEQVGDTILNTVCKFRMEKAAQLLVSTTRQVAEIAIDVGFESTNHFTRKFQEAFGVSPSQYRKNRSK